MLVKPIVIAIDFNAISEGTQSLNTIISKILSIVLVGTLSARARDAGRLWGYKSLECMQWAHCDIRFEEGLSICGGESLRHCQPTTDSRQIEDLQPMMDSAFALHPHSKVLKTVIERLLKQECSHPPWCMHIHQSVMGSSI